ncbi:MAG TPA: cupin domain-containing protein [Candidatus Ozemobacteraceae bacterium]|nr:cupin domain-containing protein [Candidatus Ozemobacteraceae bacterium]
MNTLATLRAYARPVYRTLLPLLGAALFLTGIPQAAVAKDQKKAAEAKAPDSHRFFSFDDAPYFTSPDKRIGVKMLIDSAKVGPTLSALQHLTMLPTAHLSSHRHVYVTESIYVLKGNLTLRIDKEVKVLGPNAAAYIPPQTFHEYLNNSQDVVEFLQYYSPSGPEEEYRTWERPDAPKKVVPEQTAPAAPTDIVRPPLRPIPGSPQPLLGTVQTEAAPEASASQTAPVATKPVPGKPSTMEFKLREKPRSVNLGSSLAPASAPASVGTLK